MAPTATPEANKLLLDGSLAFAQIERNGMRVDLKQLKKTKKKLKKEEAKVVNRMKQDDIFRVWEREFGTRMKLGARQQLARVLYDVMEYERAPGMTSMDEEALARMRMPFTDDYIRWQKIQKMQNTYITGMQKWFLGDVVYPVFNLHIPRTYRSSSDSPNFQNLPIRDQELAQLIRRLFIPRKNHHIVEVDYGQIEVRIAACYHNDPTMIEYINNPKKDMHRDMAMECYKIRKPEHVDKNVRQCGKGSFVFPAFYGSYWAQLAPDLWNEIEKQDLRVRGVKMKKHLKKQGIRKLGEVVDGKPQPGTFQAHIKKVEDHFWNERFGVYNKWRQDWYDAYTRNLWFRMKTGFVCTGIMNKNDVINYPIQGPAFHCLLWSLIEIIRKCEKYCPRSLIVGQIHDSIVGDIHKKELKTFLEICMETMTVDLLKHWDWITVPLVADAEVAPLGEPWSEKKDYTLVI